MPEESRRKIVFITGSSSGIGRATAWRFAQGGYDLALTYHQDKWAGEETVNQSLVLGAPRAHLVHLDLSADSSIKQAVNQVIRQYGQIDILINNAGALTKGLLEATAEKDIDNVLAVNLGGLIKLTKYCLPYAQASVVNIGSNLALQGKKQLSVYSASKWGIRGFSKGLAEERKDLKIYTINPTLTATKMGSPSGIPPEKVAAIIFKAATGQYRAKSGADINVRDYLYGEKLGRILRLLRIIKKFFSSH